MTGDRAVREAVNGAEGHSARARDFEHMLAHPGLTLADCSEQDLV